MRYVVFVNFPLCRSTWHAHDHRVHGFLCLTFIVIFYSLFSFHIPDFFLIIFFVVSLNFLLVILVMASQNL